MPTNVPPQYYEAEKRFRAALTPQAKIAALEEMMAIMPKHKGTDHLRADLRARMSQLMEELSGGGKGGGKGARTEPFSLPREGARRATLIGPPNSGKSTLLARATGAQARVGSYGGATQEPIPGMFICENIPIQLVDTPPISIPRIQGRLYGLLRNSDVLIVVVDLSLDPVAQARDVLTILTEWGFQTGPAPEGDGADGPWQRKPIILAAAKADIPTALDAWQALEAEFSGRLPVVMTSALEGVGLEDLAREVFRSLDVIRVYPKSPRTKIEEMEWKDPLVLPIGSVVGEAAEKLHKELGSGLKYAVLWGKSGKFEAQRVGRDHRLADEDVVEFHT